MGKLKRNLDNCRVVLTGASSGIGRCLAEQLAADGAKLALVARSEEKLRKVADHISTNRDADVLVLPANVTREDDRRHIMQKLSDHFGGLDVLINNAGVASWAHFSESNEDVMRQVMEVNFFAPVELTRLAIPILTQGRQPAVLNVVSMCGRRALPAWPEYSASKYALCGMIEALRGELARFDIDVLTVLPGLTRTGLHDNMLMKKGRAEIDFASGMQPEYVASQIIRALQNNKTETVIGRDARWMLLVNRFFPRLVDKMLARKVRKLYAQTT